MKLFEARPVMVFCLPFVISHLAEGTYCKAKDLLRFRKFRRTKVRKCKIVNGQSSEKVENLGP